MATFQEAFDNFVIPHCEHPIFIRKTGQTVPCGHCPLCLRAAKNEWRTRLNCELRTHMHRACFLTLTFNEDNVSISSYYEIQKFLKRFRFFYRSVKIKYFGAFERGEQYDRPHYHILIFGVMPKISDFFKQIARHPDLKVHTTSECIAQFIWKRGFVKCDSLTAGAIDYVSAYVAKKFEIRATEDQEYNRFLRFYNKYSPNDDAFKELGGDKRKPFYFMSKGLGFDYLFKHLTTIAKKKRLFMNGKYYSLPRAFVKVIKALFAGWHLPLHKYKVWWQEKFPKPLLDYNWTDWYNFHLFVWDKMKKYVTADLYKLTKIQFNANIKKVKLAFKV